MISPAIWPDDGPPRSRRYGDLYFSATDGLAESRAVFLAGCGLPETWRGRRRFTVAELGFGTGLNIAALIELWRRHGADGAWLSVFSVEAEPLPTEDAARALARWPELADVAGALLAGWPGRARGVHRLDMPAFRATVDIAVMEAGEALDGWAGLADAWFLDGFAPRLNPQIWREEVLRLVAARSAPGATAASYTAAGSVRRGLAQAEFDVERAPGFGGKRHRLVARWPGERPADPRPPSVAIVGAGIAGASLVRAFATQGVETRLIASDSLAASAGPAALITPRLDAGLGPPAALFATAFARAVSVCGEATIARRALQLAVGPKDTRRFAAIAASDLFEPGEMRLVDAAEASERLGEAAPAALALDRALVVEPALLLEPPEVCADVGRLQSTVDGWRLVSVNGEVTAEADVVVVAAGMASARLVPGLALRPVRGQVSLARGPTPPCAVLFGGYAAPTRDGIVFGATHDRDDEDLAPREADHRRNLEALGAILPGLAASLAGQPLEARTGVRATTRDYLPLAGGIDNGLFVLTGLGSRGYSSAPLLADHVAALALGRPSPLPAPLAALVDPGRTSLRAPPAS